MMWQDVFSLTHDGRLFPKHSLLSSVLLVPFVAVFGVWGVSVLAVLVQTGTVVSIHRIASLLEPGILWTTSFVAVLIGTQILYFSGGVPYDSLGGFLVVAGVAVVGRCPFISGVLVGLAIFCRPLNAIYAGMPILFSERQCFKRLVLGLAVSVASFLLTNYFIWGGPLTLAYQRMPIYQSGNRVFTDLSGTFAWEIFASDWGDKLFGPTHGLLLFNPILIFLPICWGSLLVDRRRLAIVLFCLLKIAVVFSYGWWMVSQGGNRYLSPAVWLLTAVSIGAVNKVVISRRARESHLGSMVGN